MFGLIFFLVCIAGSAWKLALVLAGGESASLSFVDRSTWTGILGLALWLAQAWVLSLLGHFRPSMLLLFSILVFLATMVLTWSYLLKCSKIIRFNKSLNFVEYDKLQLVAIFCVSSWFIYSILALAVIPPCNHDALSYHFPKAVMFALSGKFSLNASNDFRVPYFPSNYELLVATFMTFLHGDQATGLITNFSFLMLLATSFGLFSRIWKNNLLTWTAVTILLASPVLLLHTTAHKNDLLMTILTLNALVWLGRYSRRGGFGSAVIGILSLGMAMGTKFHGLFIALASILFLWQAWRRGIWRPTFAVGCLQLILVLGTFLLLGSVQYVANLSATGHLMGLTQTPVPNGMNTIAFPAFWQLPRFFWMLLTAPLFIRGQYFIIPWNGEMWFWPGYGLFFSHFGIHISGLIILLPFSIRKVKKMLSTEIYNELVTISLMALVLVLTNCLIGLRPYGSFCFIPRFILFGLPFLLVWTWCPWALQLVEKRNWGWIPSILSIAIFSSYTVATVKLDEYTPFRYVEYCWFHPEMNREIYHCDWRAASVIDRSLPDDASVAYDGGYDGWTYPLYGRHLSRKVSLILQKNGPYIPGPDVGWVAIDYSFIKVWGNPLLQCMNQTNIYFLQGTLSTMDRRVFDSLQHNPDFKLVYFLPDQFQAVFRRIHPALAQTRF